MNSDRLNRIIKDLVFQLIISLSVVYILKFLIFFSFLIFNNLPWQLKYISGVVPIIEVTSVNSQFIELNSYTLIISTLICMFVFIIISRKQQKNLKIKTAWLAWYLATLFSVLPYFAFLNINSINARDNQLIITAGLISLTAFIICTIVYILQKDKSETMPNRV